MRVLIRESARRFVGERIPQTPTPALPREYRRREKIAPAWSRNSSLFVSHRAKLMAQ